MVQISNMPRKIGEWINIELHNAQLYRVLARSAPNDRDKQIIEEFSDDSQDTAETLMKIYKKMTGYRFEPKPVPLKENGSYRSVVKSRIREEIRLSKMYRQAYMNMQDNYPLRRIIFNAYHTALEHAVTLIEMISAS